MKTTALIEKGKDGTFGIFTPDINHTIIGSGNTVAEAKADFVNSLQEMILSYTETNRDIPQELLNAEFEYKFDLSSFFDYYNWINVSKLAKVAGINASLMRQYKTGQTYISEAQTQRIESTLHKLGAELIAVRL